MIVEYAVTQFTPWSGLLGGALIGVSSGLLLLFAGRIAGISGIASGLMSAKPKEVGWRAAFIAGLIVAALAFPLFTGNPLSIDIQTGVPMMAIGGFLVGFGTRMGSGCTAGHGISGLSRLSKRSLIATVTFFATALVTVYLIRHGMG